MANLLSRQIQTPPLPCFDPDQLARFGARFASLVSIAGRASVERELERRLRELEPEVEELESDPSLVSALALLDEIEGARRGSLDVDGERPVLDRSASAAGDLLCHWPGRSHNTGEAAIASRDFFDGLDRPPLRGWLEAVGQRRAGSLERVDVVILTWIPGDLLERARAGCQACPGGSLAFLGEVSPELANQLDPILRGAGSP